jgi:hypothetical protein
MAMSVFLTDHMFRCILDGELCYLLCVVSCTKLEMLGVMWEKILTFACQTTMLKERIQI